MTRGGRPSAVGSSPWTSYVMVAPSVVRVWVVALMVVMLVQTTPVTPTHRRVTRPRAPTRPRRHPRRAPPRVTYAAEPGPRHTSRRAPRTRVVDMPDFVEVADRVWVARYEWADANVTAIGSERGVVVVDTHGST